MRTGPLFRSCLPLLFCAAIAFTQPGCAGFLSHMVYWVKGNMNDAKCTALIEKKVAVVCVTGERVEGLGLNNEGESLSRAVATLLQKNVKKINVIPIEEIADWRDTNQWDEIDYRTIGRGVKADMVVGIDLSSFGLNDDSTLLRGKAGIKVTVYDIQNDGRVVFREGPKEFAFPENSARHAVENEANFHRIFIYMLAQDIARNFYPYDRVEDVAKDASFLGN